MRSDLYRLSLSVLYFQHTNQYQHQYQHPRTSRCTRLYRSRNCANQSHSVPTSAQVYRETGLTMTQQGSILLFTTTTHHPPTIALTQLCDPLARARDSFRISFSAAYFPSERAQEREVEIVWVRGFRVAEQWRQRKRRRALGRTATVARSFHRRVRCGRY